LKSWNLCFFALLAIIIFVQFDQEVIPQASAEEIFLNLHFAPSIVESREGVHSIGFVNIVNRDGEPVLANKNIEITLVSENPAVATVEPNVVIPQGRHYANFDVILGSTEGNVEISAAFEDQMVSQNLMVGAAQSSFPDDLLLEIRTPITEMYGNTEAPLSVFLKSSSGNIVPVAEDLVITLDYEESMIRPAVDEIILKKGDYYGITTITSLDKLGNSFIRAVATDLDLSSVIDVKILAVQDSKLQVYIFPDRVTEYNDRRIEIFVGVQDENGVPTVATKDIPLKISADNESLAERIKVALGGKQVMIKRGEHGFHVQANLIFQNIPENHTISVSSENYQGVSKLFDVVKPMGATDAKANNKTVKVFVPSELPTGSKAIVVYQTGAVEDDDDDVDTVTDSDDETGVINPRVIDDLEDGDVFPVQSGLKFTGTGSEANMKITSSDNSILEIVSVGRLGDTEAIATASGYGVATIQTGQKTGEVTITVSMDGWGVGSAKTTVVNIVEATQTVIFSPADNTILLDEEGKFELLFLALDVTNRPTSSEKVIKYLVKPVNELVEIQLQKNFVTKQFSAGPIISNLTSINAVQVGIDSNPDLEITTEFKITPTSTVKVILPFERMMGTNQIDPIGIVQMVDYYGNPIQTTKNNSVTLSSSNEGVLTVPKTVTIPAGSSFVNFPITTTPDTSGTITISSSAKNMQGSSTQLFVETLAKQLKLFVLNPADDINPGQDNTVQIFVDDERAKPVSNVIITLTTSDDASATPDRMTTNSNGEVSFIFKAETGPTASFTIKASKVGFESAEKTVKLDVSGSEAVIEKEADDSTPIIIYAVVGVAVLTAAAMVYFIFLKPRKKSLEDEEEI